MSKLILEISILNHLNFEWLFAFPKDGKNFYCTAKCHFWKYDIKYERKTNFRKTKTFGLGSTVDLCRIPERVARFRCPEQPIPLRKSDLRFRQRRRSVFGHSVSTEFSDARKAARLVRSRHWHRRLENCRIGISTRTRDVRSPADATPEPSRNSFSVGLSCSSR